MDTALVYIFRPSAPPLALRPMILVNGVKVAKLTNQGYFDIELEPGRYTIKADWTWDSGVPDNQTELDVEAGQTYYVAVSSDMHYNGFVSSGLTTVPIMGFSGFIGAADSEGAKRAMLKCGLVERVPNSTPTIRPQTVARPVKVERTTQPLSHKPPPRLSLLEVPAIGQTLGDLPKSDTLLLANSGTLTPSYVAEIQGIEYDIGVDHSGKVLFVSTTSAKFITPDGCAIADTLGDLLAKYPDGKKQELGWGSYVMLPSGWGAFEAYDGTHDPKAKVRFFFKRGR